MRHGIRKCTVPGFGRWNRLWERPSSSCSSSPRCACCGERHDGVVLRWQKSRPRRWHACGGVCDGGGLMVQLCRRGDGYPRHVYQTIENYHHQGELVLTRIKHVRRTNKKKLRLEMCIVLDNILSTYLILASSKLLIKLLASRNPTLLYRKQRSTLTYKVDPITPLPRGTYFEEASRATVLGCEYVTLLIWTRSEW